MLITSAMMYGRIFRCNLFGRQAGVSGNAVINRYIMHNEGRLFKSSYPKSFCDLVGKNGVIIVQGELHRKLHGISMKMIKLEKLNSNVNFLDDVQMVMLRTLNSFKDNEVVVLHNVCWKLIGFSSKSNINEISSLFSNFVDGCLSVPINLHGFVIHTSVKESKSIILKIKNGIETWRHKAGSESKLSSAWETLRRRELA